MPYVTQHTGEIAALLAAMCWAMSTVMYRPIGYRLSAGVMNFYKGILASLLLIVMIGIVVCVSGFAWPVIEFRTSVLLAVSGLIGIGLGDTLFFASLRQVGARRAMLLTTLGPPLTALIGLVYPGESLSLHAWLGILLTIAGVAWVITERSELKGPESAEHHTGRGVLWGVLFSVSAAVSTVISRDAMDDTAMAADVSALIRLLAGTATVGLMLPLLRLMERQNGTSRPRMSPGRWGLFAMAVFFGTFLGIWLFQVAVAHTQAGIALTLASTATLFVLPIAAVMGERVSLRAIIGAAVAVLGIVLLIRGG